MTQDSQQIRSEPWLDHFVLFLAGLIIGILLAGSSAKNATELKSTIAEQKQEIKEKEQRINELRSKIEGLLSQ